MSTASKTDNSLSGQGALFEDGERVASPSQPPAKSRSNMPSRNAPYEEIVAALGTPRFDYRLSQCVSDWQKFAMAAWRQRYPEPTYFHAGALGWMDVTPIPCGCTKCGGPAMIFPAERGETRSRNGSETMPGMPGCDYCLCPKCSLPKPHLQVVG